MKEILEHAYKDHYGVAAPNISMDMEARAALEAAEDLKAPIILDVLYFANPDIAVFGSYLTKMAEQASVPVAINLDHGAEFSHAIFALRAGFTSIMTDRSTLPYDENVAQVAELVKIAHSIGITVEAELGHVGMGSNYQHDGVSDFTEPAQALDYIQKTGIDCLAIAIGTAHGTYKGTPKLEFDLLTEIKELTKFPLVLHGSSGTGDANLQKACQLGINKVNVAHDLFKAAHDNLLKSDMSGNNLYNLWNVCKAGINTRLKELIECFGSKGKAWVPAIKGIPRADTTMAG
jgi:fructose-bisphosphate aldolase class II